ncbi:MAG: hypothetical protein ACJ0QL_03240 [Parvicellaceae bacterium]
MKTIGDRISFEKHADYYTIIISSKIEQWKVSAMLVWLIAWTFCGLTFSYYLAAGSLSSQENTILLVLLIFWGYLEFKIVKTYLWRRFGVEYIRIDADRITHKKAIKGYGKANYVYLNNIVDVSAVGLNEKSFAKVFNDSFWLIGAGVIQVKSNLKSMYVGVQLENSEAEKLVKQLQKIIKSFSVIP